MRKVLMGNGSVGMVRERLDYFETVGYYVAAGSSRQWLPAATTSRMERELADLRHMQRESTMAGGIQLFLAGHGWRFVRLADKWNRTSHENH